MNKLKIIILLFSIIFLSFLISAFSTTPPSDEEYHMALSTNIPEEHKIKIIIHGNGSVLVNDIKRNNGDVIICKRFSSLKVKIIPDANYKVKTIKFDNEDITSDLDENIITLSSITKDASLNVKFKPLPDKTSLVKRLIPNSFLSLVHTGNIDMLIIAAFLTLIVLTLIYIIYYLIQK